MQDTKLVHLVNKARTKTIKTTLSDQINKIILSDGHQWFEAAQSTFDSPIELSDACFQQVELLITPSFDPG